MTSVPQRLRDRHEQGITVFDIASTVTVLGIVIVTMFVAFGGVTIRSALAQCQQEGSMAATAILRYDAGNPATPLTNVNYVTRLTKSTTDNGPFLASWPSNFPHYAFTVLDGTLWVFTGNNLSATTPPVATALSGSDIAPGALGPSGVMRSTAHWINYDAYGPNACAGVQ
jgi:hypothetical protein